MDVVFDSLCRMKLAESDLKSARYYVEKRKALTILLELGEYGAHAAELDMAKAEQDKKKTIDCAEKLLKSVDSLGAFSRSPLYAHMAFKEIDPAFMEKVKQLTWNNLFSGKELEYMADDPRWNEIRKAAIPATTA